MSQVLKNIFHFFVLSNLFVACCSLALLLSSQIIAESYNYDLSIFIFFATIAAYNFQRIIRIKEVGQNSRRSWFERNKKIIICFISISLFVSLYYYYSFNIKTKIAIIICGVISLLYPFGLREVPFLKVFIIAITWAICTFLLLVLENNITIELTTLFHFFTRLLFVLAITIPFDIRDLSCDDPKLKTIPIFFGESNSRIISVLFLILSELIYMYLFFFNALDLYYFIAISTSYFITLIFLLKSTSKKTDMYFSFGVESTSIIFYIILLISSCMV